jgi:hypothetical protein
MKKFPAAKWYALAFGLFLGLCLWKFGNPVILDTSITPPTTLNEHWRGAWPLRWTRGVLLVFAAWGGWLLFRQTRPWPRRKSLWGLPLAWLGWQVVSATQTVDRQLTTATLWQFGGCVACYFIGLRVLARDGVWRWLMPGLFVAFIYCLICAVDQRLYEFPQDRQFLLEGQQSGWTNFPAETIVQMKRDHAIITTNGVAMANPVLLEKFARGRVFGTLVYPNALAGIILLLFPMLLVWLLGKLRGLKTVIQVSAPGLVSLLGLAAFYWSGSKLGWLIGLGMGGFFLLNRPWPLRFKLIVTGLVLVGGLGLFTLRFQSYIATGAHSANARMDYWRAAVETALTNPLTGTGPGTFQRSYEQIKSPDQEMARLVHNDYLEQFSDSGIPGGLFYVAWISLALWMVGRGVWEDKHKPLAFAIFAGLLGWFVQGLGEFSLYVPALAWTAFTLLGCLVGQIKDKAVPTGSSK